MIRSLLLLTALGSMIFLLTDCKKSDDAEPGVEEVQLQKLLGTWKALHVSKDGVAQPGYDNFKLTISGTTTKIDYVSSGRPASSPWPATGVLTFGPQPATDLVREDLPMTYSVTDSQLEITLMYDGAGFPSRITDVKGQWIFTLTKP